ncbi:unnamed protein product [Gordionus sp. m RMFG-2023]
MDSQPAESMCEPIEVKEQSIHGAKNFRLRITKKNATNYNLTITLLPPSTNDYEVLNYGYNWLYLNSNEIFAHFINKDGQDTNMTKKRGFNFKDFDKSVKYYVEFYMNYKNNASGKESIYKDYSAWKVFIYDEEAKGIKIGTNIFYPMYYYFTDE